MAAAGGDGDGGDETSVNEVSASWDRVRVALLNINYTKHFLRVLEKKSLRLIINS